MNKPRVRSEIVQINDIEMYYEIHGAGEPLVLLHGGGGVGANWQLIFQEAPVGFQLIVPDLRGHGSSTNSSPEFTFRQAALDVFALLDQLGVNQFRAVGVSMGAKTLLHMATQQSTRIEAMVLVSAAPYFPEQARVLMRQASGMTHTEAEWRQMREWHKGGDEQILALWRLPKIFQDSFADMNFTPPYLGTITARTLIVHGDRDPLYPVNLAVEMFAAIPASCLWIVPNGGHGPIFGAHAPHFVETTLAFLKGEWQS